MRNALIFAVLAATLATGYSRAPGSDGYQKVVLQVNQDVQNSGPAPVHEILDLGLPPIKNISDSTVRLRAVQLVSPSSAVSVIRSRPCLAAAAATAAVPPDARRPPAGPDPPRPG
jgi:hypothetical protein